MSSETLAPTIPETAPTVSFDRSLGKRFSFVGFNYGEFALQADRIGVDQETISDLRVQILPPSRTSTKGVYYVDYPKDALDSEENLKLVPCIDVVMSNDVNKSLAHEMKHASDGDEGLLKFDTRYKIGEIAAKGHWLFVPGVAMSGFSLGLVMTGQPSLPVTVAGLGISALGVISSVGEHYGYATHPDEKRANEASKNPNKTITVIPR
jgi:hypothetical protein